MKDAKQKAARAVIKSILATENTCMMGIIRSKKNLFTAIKSSRNNKDTGVPIKFTRPVAYTAYGGQDHVASESQDESSLARAVQRHTIAPAVEPSAKTVTGSKKRKGRVEGPEVNEARGC